LLFPDFFQRFFPSAIVDDRAIALEQSWEQGWAECERDLRTFAEPYENLWVGDKAFNVLLLFLNSTVVETGQRMIASPLPLEVASFKKFFSDALETTRVVGHKIPLSSAVHTSARFTYLSPAGTVRRLDLDEESTEDDRLNRVVDGGYFENSGTVMTCPL